MTKELSIHDLISIRKRIWSELGDIGADRQLTNQLAKKIISSRHIRDELEKSPHLLIECCFSVVDKRKRSVPFFFNSVQRDFISRLEDLGTSKPYFILKGRQQGFTTLITAIQLSYAIIKRNFSGFTLADRDDNTKAIFVDKAKSMYSSLPACLKPTEKFNSTNELFFDKINSSWRIASASSNIGRSRTLSFIHYSEIAFFRCPLSDLQKSIQEAAISDALCIYETTANGFNEAKELWDSNSCHNLFYEWWKTEEYVSRDYEYLETGDTWLRERLKMLEAKGLCREQRAWYAKKYASYIDKSSIKQEYPCTPEEAFITSGDCIFDKEAIASYLSQFEIKHTCGYFSYKKELLPILGEGGGIAGFEKRISQIEFKECPNGYIRIVEKPYLTEEKGAIHSKPYVIGADTAGLGTDYFTAKVIDNVSGRSVATLQIQKMDEDLFAEQLYCLGKYYNNALLGVETNFSRHPVRVLRELGYENLYVSKSIQSQQDGFQGNYGFVTTSVSRPIIISNLVSVMRDNLRLETDRETLKEMTTFIKRADGKSAGASGSHDDLVMASAIARFIAIDYSHEIEISYTGEDILKKCFTDTPLQEETYMEW